MFFYAKKYYYGFYIVIIFLVIIIVSVFYGDISFDSDIIQSNTFIWPTLNYKTITCPFGPRKSPTTGASTFHTGIDIGAPEGTNILAITNGKVTYCGFKGADGYTIILENKEYQIIYGHCNPKFLVNVGDSVKQGKIIGKVGPKYVYDNQDNPYHDKFGPTNGATTGPHLHLTIKKNGNLINPIELLET